MDGYPLVDKIIRSGRKTMAIEVNQHAEVIVRIPRGVPESAVTSFIQSHLTWIEKKKNEALNKWKRSEKTFKAGEKFYFRGELYPLYLTENGRHSLYFDEGFHLNKQYLPYARELLVAWYRSKARIIILPIINRHATLMNVQFKNVGITRAEKRWGSCSSNGNINFSYRMAMLPDHLVEYIVVHELVHILEMNHSRNFWNKVQYYYSNYLFARDELKKTGHLYRI